MNVVLITLAVVLGGSSLSALVVPLSEWVAVAKSLMTVFAIFAAAILVRLNRGMPTIDWSKVKPENRSKLVEDIQKLAREYRTTLIFVGLALVFLLIIDRSGFPSPLGQIIAAKPRSVQIAISAMAGAINAFVLCRIAFVVWRDIDIVDLQAGVIAQAANAEMTERANKLADTILESGVVNPHQKLDDPSQEC